MQAQVGLGMSPMRIELGLAPGQTRSGSVMVSNQSADKVRARGELLDFRIDESGTPQFKRSMEQEAEFSCRPWLSLNPMEVELGPHSQQMVRYTIRVPQQAPVSSFHCALGYTSAGTAEQMTTDGIGIRMAVRVVAAIYVTIGNPATSGTIKEIKAEAVSDSAQHSWRGVVVLDNPTLMHYRPSGEFALLDRDGKVLESLPFVSLPVLPKRQQRYLFPLKTVLEAGEYRLRARIDLGANEIQEGTVVFQAPKPEQ
jgi:hypothetical protein